MEKISCSDRQTGTQTASMLYEGTTPINQLTDFECFSVVDVDLQCTRNIRNRTWRKQGCVEHGNVTHNHSRILI